VEIIRGIYVIECISNGKFYIGSSVNIHKRFIRHQSDLTNNTHPNKHLQNAWNLYGKSSFRFSILEPVSDDIDLWTVEENWISVMNACDIGFNIQDKPLPNWNLGRKRSPETLAKLSKANKGKPYSPERLERCKARMFEIRGKFKRPNAGTQVKDATLKRYGMLVATDEEGWVVMTFRSANDAKNNGYGGVREAIRKGCKVAGFNWHYVRETT
jgi:group I intron endonuclease